MNTGKFTTAALFFGGDSNHFSITQEELDRQKEAFLSSGGVIEVLEPDNAGGLLLIDKRTMSEHNSPGSVEDAMSLPHCSDLEIIIK